VQCTTYRFARKDKQTQQHADGADDGRCERSNADEEKGVGGGLDERVGGVDAQTKGSKEGVHGWFGLSCLRTDKKTDKKTGTTTDTKTDETDAATATATATAKTLQSYLQTTIEADPDFSARGPPAIGWPPHAAKRPEKPQPRTAR
jgi:hypothetical protein